MDRLTRLRTPLAVVALVALTLVALARVGLGVSELVVRGGSTAVAAARLAPNGGDGALTVLVGVLVASCFAAPVVAHRRALARWGVVLAVVSLLATLAALALTDLEVAGWSVVWLVPEIAVPVLVGAGLLVLAQPDGAGEQHPALAGVAPGADEAAPDPVPEPDPELQPAWSEDAAAGAVWRTAGEAARGAPAVGWGSSGGNWSTPALPAAPERDVAPGSPNPPGPRP